MTEPARDGDKRPRPTPRTDELIAHLDKEPESRLTFVIKQLVNHAKDIEGELADSEDRYISAVQGRSDFRGALKTARHALRRWGGLYAAWTNAGGPMMDRMMDKRLPPADHVKALEEIESAIKDEKGRPMTYWGGAAPSAIVATNNAAGPEIYSSAQQECGVEDSRGSGNPAPVAPPSSIEASIPKAKDGEWVHIPSADALEYFYRQLLPSISVEAKSHGYAIGLHGSMRRDLDLIAVPWSDEHSDRDEIARAVQLSACGMEQEKYQWTQKPCGRWATSLPVCWLDYEDDRPSAGHIDLSVVAAPPYIAAPDVPAEWHEDMRAAWEREKLRADELERRLSATAASYDPCVVCKKWCFRAEDCSRYDCPQRTEITP